MSKHLFYFLTERCNGFLVKLYIQKECSHYYSIEILLIQKCLYQSLSSGINKGGEKTPKVTMILQLNLFQ